MRVLTGLNALRRPPPRAVVTIGMFDGVHLAHQRLIRTTVRLARQRRGTSVALTFDPDPQRVLCPSLALPPLMPLAHRIELMRALGLDLVWVLPFTRRFSRITPKAFVRMLLLERLRAQCVVVGRGFAFGYRRRGGVALMARVGRPHGLRVAALPQVVRGGAPVSSSRIRALLQRGDVRAARALLGRPARLSGLVVQGQGRGRRLGFPTINVRLDPILQPATGVYRVRVWKERDPAARWSGLMNVGYRPTFLPAPRCRKLLKAARQAGGRGPLTCEVHLLACRHPWRGQRVRIELFRRLRDERRFASPEALVRQIHRDLASVRLA